jgi:hypothetical protein
VVTLQKRPPLGQSLALKQAPRPLPRIRLQLAQVLLIQAQALRQVLRLLLRRLHLLL